MGRNEYMHHEDSRGKGPGAAEERFAEITPGKADRQPGLTATGEDRASERKQRDTEALGLTHESV